MKNQICCWKQIKRTFDGGFTFMRQIYYACITQKKKKNQPKILFVSYEFQSLYFYNKESLKKKSNMYLMKIQINFEFRVNQICI